MTIKKGRWEEGRQKVATKIKQLLVRRWEEGKYKEYPIKGKDIVARLKNGSDFHIRVEADHLEIRALDQLGIEQISIVIKPVTSNYIEVSYE